MAILALDQGTHASRALLFDKSGNVLKVFERPVSIFRKSNQEVEQNAEELAESVLEVIRLALSSKIEIEAAGLATQRSTVVAWDKNTSRSLGPAISWQDTRSKNFLLQFSSLEKTIKEKTGLVVSPHYGAGKINWILENNPEAIKAFREDRLAIGPLSSFLLARIAGSPLLLVDHANASRTLLWNLIAKDWDDDLLKIFHLNKSILPLSRPICDSYGCLIGTKIPLTAVSGDQNASLFSQGLPDTNILRMNLGTGAFCMGVLNDVQTMHPDLLHGVSLTGRTFDLYTIEGTVNGAASAISWAQDYFKADFKPEELTALFETEKNPPFFCNTVGGVGSPYWKSGTDPFWSQTPVNSKQALAAVLESVVFLLLKNYNEIQAFTKDDYSKIIISGGLSNIDSLVQAVADLSRLPVLRYAEPEATAKGIAWLASSCSPDWSLRPTRIFTPSENSYLFEKYESYITWFEKTIGVY